ncbi:MAG: hypothetical protein JNN17_23270 [Verrucomicrobiaceae bacterium]|nr:hypothetical protein [Verrucomicrobiaceae bacterium]
MLVFAAEEQKGGHRGSWCDPQVSALFGEALDCGSLLPLVRGSPAAVEVSRLPESLSAPASADTSWRNGVIECSKASRLASRKRQQAAAVQVAAGV